MTPRARSSLVAVIACGACHAKAPTPAPGSVGSTPSPRAPSSWVTLFEDDFEHSPVPNARWAPDTFGQDGPYADDGAYFRARGVHPPVGAVRASGPLGLGRGAWLSF